MSVSDVLVPFALAEPVGLSVGPVLAGGVELQIAILTIGYRSIRSALLDPVTSLRYDIRGGNGAVLITTKRR